MKKKIATKFSNHMKILIILSMVCVVILSGCAGDESNSKETETTNETPITSLANESTSNYSTSSELASNNSTTNNSVSNDTLPVEIKIISPLNTVQIQERIEGTAKNVPEEKAVWIVVYPHTAVKYYPIKEARIQNEKWELPAQFGESKDTDTEFDIIALLANEQAQDEFATYLEECEQSKSWPGIDELPEGVEIYDTVTVTRV